MAFNINSLPNYVEQNKSELMTNVVLSAPSIDEFSMMPDVKGPTTLNLMSNEIKFQNGIACGFNPDGDTVLSQRTIEPGIMKVNMQWCPKDLIAKYTVHEVMLKAGRETLPFEAKIMEDLTANIGYELEKAIWQADKTDGTGNLAFFNGLGKLIKDDITSGLITAVTTSTASETMVERIKKIYMSVPEKSQERVNIYVSPANFRKYVLELVDKNMFHYTPEIDYSMQVMIPGTSTTVKAMPGLIGVNEIYALVPQEVVYGFDEYSDYSDYKIWYSDDNDLFRFRVYFAAGLQYIWPENIAVNKLS